MSSYSALAICYDSLMDGYDYSRIGQFINSKLVSNSSILDLATGTGEMAIRLANYAHRVTGVDISVEMLNVAISRARSACLDIPFVIMDMTNLALDRQFDCVTIACDGFNYIEPKKRLTTLERITRVIKDGGLLYLDYSSSYKLSNVIADNIFYTDKEDMTLLWSNQLNAKKGYVDMEIVIFTKSGDNYTRSDETHRQYIIDNQSIQSMLKQLGYRDMQLIDGDTLSKLNAKSQRVALVATKGNNR